MKARMTARAAHALGLPSLARDTARFGRECRALLGKAYRDARGGCTSSAALLILLLIVDL